MWSSKDLEWLKANYPGLKKVNADTVEGFLSFQMLYTSGKYVINPSGEAVSQANKPNDVYISDSYSIRIMREAWYSYPSVYEIGGRIEAVAQKYGMALIDLHLFPLTGELCLAPLMEYHRTFQTGFKLDIYVEEFLVPYFFAQSYFAKNRRWLWGQLSHDHIGAMEWLTRLKSADDRDIISTYLFLAQMGRGRQIIEIAKNKFTSDTPCLCDSGLPMEKCHPELRQAIERFHDVIKRRVINV
jgi:hypothetical protein